MKERKPEIEYDENKRKLLGMAFKTALGAGALGYLGAEALRAREPKISTSSGIFSPLYEIHEIGIRPEDLSPKIDIFWAETWLRNVALELSPRSLICCIDEDLKPEIISTLAQRGVELAWGDIGVKEPIKGAYLVCIESLLGSLLTGIPHYALSADKEKGTLTTARRHFLQGAMVAGGWALSQVFSETAAKVTGVIDGKITRIGAIKRITERIHGLQSHLHPEFPIVLYRNALWAHKLLTIGGKVKEELRRLPNITYLVGGGHSGVEDFLLAGREVSKIVLLAYPKSWLRDTIEINEGIENFCSTRLIRLPRDFAPKDIHTDSSKWSLVEDRKIVDDELLTALKRRLG